MVDIGSTPNRSTVGTAVFVLDSNLGLAVHEPHWADVLRRLRIEARASTDLVDIDRTLAEHRADLAFVPAADYHAFATDPHYRGLAVATSRRTGRPDQDAVLVVARDDPARSVDDLVGATLGYVNTSCSSSYFAPALLTHRDGRRLRDTFDLVLVPAWQPQIDAVVSGRVRATMVLDDVWSALPANDDRTRVIGRVEGLVPPVVIARSDLDPRTVDALVAELLAWVPPAGATYGPFVAFEPSYFERFFGMLTGLAGDP